VVPPFGFSRRALRRSRAIAHEVRSWRHIDFRRNGQSSPHFPDWNELQLCFAKGEVSYQYEPDLDRILRQQVTSLAWADDSHFAEQRK
jgi:hypothetical protein